jgi:hypothetical protein
MHAPGPQVEAELAEQVAHAPEGELEILDSRLIAGRADQGGMANSVVSHFTTTAHTLEQPDGKESLELGRVLWVRFRVRLDVAPGMTPPAGLLVEKYPCMAPARPTHSQPPASQP